MLCFSYLFVDFSFWNVQELNNLNQNTHEELVKSTKWQHTYIYVAIKAFC